MHFAGQAGRVLRSSDYLGRRANAEFAAVLPEAHLADARLCALRIQAALALEPATLLGQPVRLTFSAGVVQRRHGESMDELLGRARDALQGAQRAGMNRIKTGD
jgi:diguanylate cyclase